MSSLALRRIRLRAGLVVLVTAVAVVGGTIGRSGAAVIAPTPNPAFTLKSVDQKCFYAGRPAGGWPFLPQTRIRPIRGGFNDVRTPSTMGWTSRRLLITPRCMRSMRARSPMRRLRTGPMAARTWT